MFVGTCSGCIQVPTPVYYWNPYAAVQTFAAKKTPFGISDLLQVTQNASKVRQRDSDGVGYPTSAHTVNKHTKHNIHLRKGLESLDSHRKRTSVDFSNVNTIVDNEADGAINYSKKGKSTIACSLPSALEPLQALCSVGLRDYRGSSPSNNNTDHSKIVSVPTKGLKFGINRILGEDFGKDKPEKENKNLAHTVNQRSSVPQRPCECTYEVCRVYQHPRYHTLSAVHAIQTPRYPTSPSDTDILPGPYSVLNSEVHIGSHAKRKRSWSRAVFSNLQRKGLEKRFEVQKYVTKPDRRQLAAMLGLTDAQVKVWFQNRRMKWRHAQQVSDDAENDVSFDNVIENSLSTKTTTETDDIGEADLIIDEEDDTDGISDKEEMTSASHSTSIKREYTSTGYCSA